MFVIGSRVLPLGVLLVLSLLGQPATTRTISSNAIAKIVEKYHTLYDDIPSCKVYCHGPLLHTVQMARIFPDSKTFVDMKLKFSPDQTLKDFEAFMTAKNNTPSTQEISVFVADHFDELGKEFLPWLPTDWKESPLFLDRINDPDLKQWGADLNAIWKDLGRKMIEDVHKNPEYYSIVPVDHPVIVPGGRFIEFYYWDSYWIIRGLLHSEMYDTARGMLENFMSIVKRYGFIFNGGRVYYSQRSQPPLLAAMIKSYVDMSLDYSIVPEALEVLEHEFEYWMNNHTVQAKGYNMVAYGDNSTGPRPESYREDIISSESFATDAEKEEHFAELKAAAESGMDFSSRWFINEYGTSIGDLTNLKTRSIVPVELNAILHWNANIIAEFHAKMGNTEKSNEYRVKADKILEAIDNVHWNEEVGAWLDYDLINEKPRDYFVPTNLAPLWTHSYNVGDAKNISAAVLRYIERQGLDKYPGGVPNTLYRTGEQWDFPNVWPPMQYMLIEGLANLHTKAATALSARWGHRWVKSNFEAYRQTQTMFEKYDAERFGGHGGGGEYDVQKGFGWTNGIIIEFLSKYGRDLSMSSDNGAIGTVGNGGLWRVTGMAVAVLVVTVLGGRVL